MTDSDFTLGPGTDLLRQLWELNHHLERASRLTETLFGVTGQQRLMIRCIGKYPGLTLGQLATHFHLDPGTVSNAIDRLEEKGLLERRRPLQDRRRVTVGLTAFGRKVDAEVIGVTEGAINELLSSTSVEDIECTRRVLCALSRLLRVQIESGRERLDDGLKLAGSR
jgi:MarR family transcriptional regulator, organic hydroperoxide resistance regulator